MAKRTTLAPEIRRFEVPYTAEVGRLVNGSIGLRSVARRTGAYAPYTIDVTVLDAPDHRLVRAGIWLAHRVLDGRGEWYLAAPEWSPWLPEEQIEQMGHADIPDTFADLVRPFRRGAALGPVAALRCTREEYALRGDGAELLATLRNELVTIRSGGVVTARYREVTLTPVEDRLTPAQAAWLTEVLAQAGAARVAEFPDLTRRLGAPATGLSDLPDAHRCLRGTLEEYVQSLIARRLRRITHADLALRGGLKGAPTQLANHLDRLLADVRGLVPLLDPAWAERVEADLIHAFTALEAAGTRDGVPAALNSQRYLELLDQLVAAARAPRLGDSAHLPANRALADQLARRIDDVHAAMAGVGVDGPDEAWERVLLAVNGLVATCGVQPRRSKDVRRLRRRADHLADLAAACVQVRLADHDDALDRLGAREAFELGREFERAWAEQDIARLDLLDHWERRGSRLVAPDTAQGRR